MQLAMKYQPVNLGQGFTDYPVPQYITDALAATANSSNCLLNQYTRGFVSISVALILCVGYLFGHVTRHAFCLSCLADKAHQLLTQVTAYAIASRE